MSLKNDSNYDFITNVLKDIVPSFPHGKQMLEVEQKILELETFTNQLEEKLNQ